MQIETRQQVIGEVDLLIEHDDGRIERRHFRNTVLLDGRAALAACLANEIGDTFGFYINQMVFGNGGTQDGSPKYVQAERTGLFGMTVVSRPVISAVSQTDPNMVTFTCVVSKNDPYTGVLNEMALQMAHQEMLYSMTTFPDLNKTNKMQLTWTWTLTFV